MDAPATDTFLALPDHHERTIALFGAAQPPQPYLPPYAADDPRIPEAQRAEAQRLFRRYARTTTFDELPTRVWSYEHRLQAAEAKVTGMRIEDRATGGGTRDYLKVVVGDRAPNSRLLPGLQLQGDAQTIGAHVAEPGWFRGVIDAPLYLVDQGQRPAAADDPHRSMPVTFADQRSLTAAERRYALTTDRMAPGVLPDYRAVVVTLPNRYAFGYEPQKGPQDRIRATPWNPPVTAQIGVVTAGHERIQIGSDGESLTHAVLAVPVDDEERPRTSAIHALRVFGDQGRRARFATPTYTFACQDGVLTVTRFDGKQGTKIGRLMQ